MVTTILLPVSIRDSSIAWARAAPWRGLVPTMISSMITRVFSSASASISLMTTIWPEKVECDWDRFWSSPMSARMREKMPRRESGPAGTWRPSITKRTQRPMVFRSTVLPPVLAPDMMRHRFSPPRPMSLATTAVGDIR